MSNYTSYHKAFYMAVFLHLLLGLALLTEFSVSAPTLIKEDKNELGELTAIEKPQAASPEIVKAVSVDNQEVMAAVNRLKEERSKQLKDEQARQQQLVKQAETARLQRLQEQQRLAKLKEEAAKIALARQKQLAEEQKHLKELALQKEQEEKRLQELKNKQQQETVKLAELKKKQADKTTADTAKQKQAETMKMAEDGQKQAKIAGEVDKYKAMIVNAISRNWILPDNVDHHLSSQFRIRLAPGGEVLTVTLLKSSGDAVLDRSAQTAIYKASPLPVPSDTQTFDLFRDITLTVRPENIRG